MDWPMPMGSAYDDVICRANGYPQLGMGNASLPINLVYHVLFCCSANNNAMATLINRNRFPRQRDPRASSSLFDQYGGDSRQASRSPAQQPGGYGYGGYSSPAPNGYASSGAAGAGYQSASPDKKGHYSDAVLSSLESQNDAEVEGISAKVKMLKNVRSLHPKSPDPAKAGGRLMATADRKTI
ncbi:Pc22g11270 [Penicillium rubens Wisconsin 54-1255]|uniref:Pc22g11270 protein n=1 Tax=Penicillium rubens (strain ATCC 28089 / DSM 1075 / NRRL 1951 / Wisconsin 54-1255) TaxID=500485 RepID=B6HPY3_PENRW|nr:Pc22g11270 [Penicillium rubens Wisconsin 54-1255]